MERFWRFCRWLRLGLLFLLVLGVTGLAFYTHTDGFRDFVRQKLLAAINDSVRGKISVARLDGSVWGSLTFIDVRLVDNESEIARIPRLKVNYALLASDLGTDSSFFVWRPLNRCVVEEKDETEFGILLKHYRRLSRNLKHRAWSSPSVLSNYKRPMSMSAFPGGPIV